MDRKCGSDGGTPGPAPVAWGPASTPAPSASPSVSPASLGPSPAPARAVVFSRNRYGQVTMTSQPTNESELQLYRVLQHANLLSYYDTFISQGGDDVQQLCEAGEEEFLEIMALVGMASKPLHVRRLQKALQEWISSPRRFQLPILPVPMPVPSAAGFLPGRPSGGVIGSGGGVGGVGGVGNAGGGGLTREGPASAPPAARPPSPPSPQAAPPAVPSPAPSLGKDRDSAPSPSHSQDSRDPLSWAPPREDAGDSYPSSGSPQLPTPVLLESQIQRLAESAERVAKTLPSFEPRAQNSKKKICKELEQVMSMAPDDPKRLEKFREFAAIYGRFDCKRKAEKPLTLHEVSVNEAAAHICMQIPALLTRRDELFPLARQVVRHSGYQYSKGHSRSQGAQGFSPRDFPSSDEFGGVKRARLDSDSQSDEMRDSEWCRRQDRLEQIADELRQLRERGEELQGAARRLEAARGDPHTIATLHQQLDGLQDKERHLVTEQSSLISINKQLYKSSMDFEDEDSQFSLNSIPSPAEGGGDAKEADSSNGVRDRPNANKLDVTGSPAAGAVPVTSPLSSTPGGAVILPNQVIASSTGAIIAVANPALTLSAVSQPLSLVTHAKLERVKSEMTRVKSEPTTASGRANGRGRHAD